jgi:16S rRNA G966 N2-methylase RsmD
MIVDQFGPLVVAVDYSGPAERDQGAEALLHTVQECRPERPLVAKVRAAVDGSNRFSTAVFCPESNRVTPQFKAHGAPASADLGTTHSGGQLKESGVDHNVERAKRTEISAPSLSESEGLRAEALLIGTELGLKFEIGIDPAHDFGLFLDAAKARAFVRGTAAGRRVLNLFSYTGGFGVAAAVGGAAEVTNVDPNRDYLAWSLSNARLNGVDMRVLPDTAQAFLSKHLRRQSREPDRPGFDLVIIDPPAFGVGRGNDRVLRLLWPSLFESLRAMKPQQVLLMCNDKAFLSRRSFDSIVQKELGSLYRFERLGTFLTAADLNAKAPPLRWTADISDPFYVEPVVLAGTRS